MRPLRLTVEGFTCFKDRQGPIDFAHLDLFAISGPTGAGKSSILDAMIFALYGKVPRMGGKGLTELISLGRDRMAVVLDFRVGQDTYRVARRTRRRGATDAQLEQLVDGDERPVAEGVRQVEEHMLRLIGLRYDAFTQAVVLPQGEFQRFLKSQPRERREILRDLLRLQVYERMRELARKQQDHLWGGTQNLQERLQHEYAGVTAAALDEQRKQLEQLALENKQRKKGLKNLDTELAALRLRFDKSCELVAKRETLHGFAKRESEINALSEKLAAAVRASAVVPAVKAAANHQKAAEEAARRAADAALARGSAQQSHETARAELTKEQKAAERIAALRERISALDQLVGVLEARAATTKRKNGFEHSKQKCERELADLEGKSQATSKALLNSDADLQKAVVALAKEPFDKELGARLDAAREKATHLTALREELDGDRKEATQLTAESKQRDVTAKTSQTSAEELAEALVHATKGWKGADEALREAERHNAGLVLRDTLALAQPCPVCDQSVAKLPRKHKVVELAKLKTGLEQRRNAMERAKMAADAARDAAIKAISSADASKKAAEAAVKKVNAEKQRLAKAEADLDERVGEDTRKEKGKTIEERVLAAAKKAVDARKRFEAATQLHRAAELAQQKAKHEYDQNNGKLTACRERRDDAVKQIQQTDEEIAALAAQIQKVSTAPDPLGERKELAGEIGALEKNLKAAQVAENKAGSALATAVEAARQTAANAATAQEAATKARQQAHEAALEAGFPDEVVAVEAALPRDEQRALETAVNQFKRDRSALEKRVGDLEAEIGSDLVTSEQFEELENRVKEERRRYEDAIRSEASLKTTVENLQNRLAVAEQLSMELQAVKEEHRIYKQLADDLRSERFQAYLLDEAFRELVSGASVRLIELSGRYTFDYRDDAFFVLDHDNAQEQRSTDTLSGGETFLASLALALELSQQVQRAAGAVSLDSLFIDEGFGTLDAETLDTVASAIESLRVGGRMVGIITHIPELTARLPERITVEKRSEGSRVSIEVD
jgi:exonuclease SbcC